MLGIEGLYKKFATRDKTYNEFWALSDINCQIAKEEFCAIVGESGSGKSTLAAIMAGLIPTTKGSVFLDEQEISPSSRRKNKEIAKKIQLMLQDGKSALDPHFTVYKCIAEPLRNICHLSKAQERASVLALLEQMELEEDILYRKPHQLSGGQQKRVCMARALATNPDILIFDEATSGLDVIVRQKILELLKKIHQKQKCTVIFITHDIDVALYMASRIIVMKDGRILENVANKGGHQCLMHPYSRKLIEAVMPEIKKVD